jgi:ABC-type proline/glycine betaine transport system permease subunit
MLAFIRSVIGEPTAGVAFGLHTVSWSVSKYVETVIVTVVTAETLPSVAVTVAVYVPVGTELVAAIVALLIIESSLGSIVAEDGENATVRPLGAVPPPLGTIDAESVTVPCKPPPGITTTD